jgi:S1-C subfamily serine protease
MTDGEGGDGMSEQQGRHAVPGGASAPDASVEAGFARPADVEGGFAPHDELPAYVPPPPTVSPAERAVFGRPDDAEAFAPAPGERLSPRPTANPPVPQLFAEAFGVPADAADGFAPAPGTRMPPSGAGPESPWWNTNAPRDPWRDPTSPYWLGSGAVFAQGRPAQLHPAADTEVPPDTVAVPADDDEDLEREDTVRRGRTGRFPFLAVLLVALLAGGVGGLVGWLLTANVHSALHRPDVSIAQVQTPTSRPPTSVAGVAKRVGPAVVSITVKTPSEFGIGSGVVIDRDGDVLTNNHVIAAAVGVRDSSIVVTFSNESTAKATVVGHDPTSDLAVIKVPNDQLTVAQLGDSDKLAVGDPVIAIGSPLGLQGTVTAGIVSALNRPVHVFSDNNSSDAYLDAIQTDAPINPGNSGGALVNSSGAVIGINSAAALGAVGPPGSQSTPNGIGYAIPINYARTIALELIHTGTASHASLGAQGSTALAGVRVGAYLKQVSPGGPAAKAGLKPGDVVVAADGQLVQSFDQLVVIVQEHVPGDRISVTYYRGSTSTKVTTTVTLG